MAPPRRIPAVLCLVALALVACGGEPGPTGQAPRVELRVSELDGAPPTQGLTVERMEKSRASGRQIPLRPVSGQPLVFEAPGAEDGHYYLRLSDGWGHLVLNAFPRLEAGGPPARFRVGRPHSLYLVSHQPTRLLGDDWGARTIGTADAPAEAIPLEVQQDPAGITILRIPAAFWGRGITLMGRYVDGGLTELVLTELKPHGRPVYRELDPQPLAPLRVVAVAAGPPADDVLTAEIETRGLPLVERQQVPVTSGAALFRGVPTDGSGLRVALRRGERTMAVELPPGSWRQEGEVRLHAPPEGTPFEVPLGLLGAEGTPRVQGRLEGGASYGLLPVSGRLPETTGFVALEPGRWRLLLDTGTAMRTLRVEVEAAERVRVLEETPFEAPAVVQGSLLGGQARRLLWQREEDGLLVLGQGFVMQVDADGRYRGSLPPGTYQLVLEDPRGNRDKPRRFVLTPGMQLSLPLGG